MAYIEAIKTACILFPLIAFLFTIPFMLHEYHKYGSIGKFKTLIVYSFILYMMTIYFLVILPLPKPGSVVEKTNMIRLIPFGFIKDIVRESSFVLTSPSTYVKALTEPCFYTVIFNVFMTIPFGMYLRFYFKCNLKKTVLYSFLLSLFFELTQVTGLYFIYPHPYRVFDVDDLLTNTLGGLLGYLIMGILDNYLPTKEELDENARKVGEEVSGLRRITLFFLDFFLYLFFASLTSLFLRNYHPFLIVFFLYYVLIPFIKKGHTLGGSFLHVKLEYKNAKLVRSIFRSLFLYLYYFILPFCVLVGNYLFLNHLGANATISIYFYLLSIAVVFCFFCINGLIIITKRKMFYDQLCKVNYKSTIREEHPTKEELRRCGKDTYRNGYRIVYFYKDKYEISTWASKIKNFMMDFASVVPIMEKDDIPKFISKKDLVNRYLEDDKEAIKVAIYKVNGTLVLEKEREEKH